MTPQQIKEAEDRAAEIINGFKCATQKQANDVLRLARVISDRDRKIVQLDYKIEELKKKLLAHDLTKNKANRPLRCIF